MSEHQPSHVLQNVHLVELAYCQELTQPNWFFLRHLYSPEFLAPQ